MTIQENFQALVRAKELRGLIRDRDWLMGSYIQGRTTYSDLNKPYSRVTAARFKFTDTTLGGNICINPLPQFTETADIPVEGIVKANEQNKVGRYYSEYIDENKRLISVRCGVPQFLGAFEFFTGFYNADLSYLARTGRQRGVIQQALYGIGTLVGFVIPLAAFKTIGLLNIAGNAYNYLTQTPRHKYYYMKPTMPTYWMTVTTIINLITANRGIVPRALGEQGGKRKDDTFDFNEGDIKIFQAMLGDDVVFDNGGLNVYGISTRSQRLARRVYAAMEKKLIETMKLSAANGAIVGTDELRDAYRAAQGIYDGSEVLNLADPPAYVKFTDYLGKWFGSIMGSTNQPNAAEQPNADSTFQDGISPASTEVVPALRSRKENADGTIDGNAEPVFNASLRDSIWDYMKAEWDDGSSFVTFRVDAEGGSQESFSNQAGEPSISATLNGKAGDARSTAFSLSGGQLLGEDSLAQKALNFVGDSVSAVVSGLASGLGMAGLGILAGNAFVDIPKHWQSSVAQLPRMNYTMTLTSPYNNAFSQLFNIYLPLSMLMAMALPRSTGAYSYTSPFLCELYDRGRAQSRLCMVDSFSINRGTHELAFDRNGNALGMEISISFIDLSSVMHVPITDDWSITNLFDSMFDYDSAFNDYISVLSALTLHEVTHTSEMISIHVRRFRLGMQNRWWTNSARFAQVFTNLPGLRLGHIFLEGIQDR